MSICYALERMSAAVVGSWEYERCFGMKIVAMGPFRTAGGFSGSGRVCSGDCAVWFIRDRDGDTEAGRVLAKVVVRAEKTGFDGTPAIEDSGLTGGLDGEDGFRGTAVTVTRVPEVLLDDEDVVEAVGLDIFALNVVQTRKFLTGDTGIRAPYIPFCIFTASERVF